jgi:integrase
MATKINFTKSSIDALPMPEVGRIGYFRDKVVRGLILAVQPTGTKVFYLYKWVGTKPVRFRIGKYPDLDPQTARKKAQEALGEIARGDNPQKARQKARRESAAASSLHAVWEQYRDHHLAKNCASNSVRNHSYFISAIPFTKKKLSDITTEDIRQLHRKLTERAPMMANSTVAFIRTLYRYAADEMNYTGTNPVAIRVAARGDRRRLGGIVLNRKQSRKRYLNPDELPAFFKALKAETDEDFRDLVLLLLFTGARRGNLQAMRWSEVSLERRLWTIPMTKNGDPVTIPLSSWAGEVLKQRAAKRQPEVDFVFPSDRAKSGHIEEPKKQWHELLKRAKLSDLHMHDLRRTLATYQRTTGATLEMIGASLGHRSLAATEIYARVDPEPVRESVSTATRALLDAGKFELAIPVVAPAPKPASGFVVRLARDFYGFDESERRPFWDTKDKAKVFETERAAKSLLHILDRSRVMGAVIEPVEVAHVA